MLWIDLLLLLSILFAVSRAVDEDQPFEVELKEGLFKLSWKQAYTNYSKFVVAVQHADNSLEEIELDHESFINYAVPCYFQSARFYGWQKLGTKELLGTFSNEDGPGFIEKIHTVRVGDEYFVSWHELDDCPPDQFSIILNSKKGQLDNQDAVMTATFTRFQHIPGDDPITVCITSVYYGARLEELSVCMLETPVHNSQANGTLQLVPDEQALKAMWSSQDNNYEFLTLLVICDMHSRKFDVPPTDQSTTVFYNYDPCIHCTVALYAVDKFEIDYLLGAAVHKPGKHQRR
ncbi:hypothetical protein P879_03951 [Paragonimus westermani]|uniref:Uncharacterized protein n=1 Tax=Paragonimus westermani TaxID=34504 RepID=A0A8T0DCC1_9TREM|nr:hypothetical protein P879_03951 [Paragonimus westermani]